ncbi:hypothetical protein OTU49_007305 [Cherax quadricarinatus]|uniref:Uncharacterized protein n=1 Tax=Cherax quadricarinatus TaxID=27406 RepID=A0AAW0WX99_CHEQU
MCKIKVHRNSRYVKKNSFAFIVWEFRKCVKKVISRAHPSSALVSISVQRFHVEEAGLAINKGSHLDINVHDCLLLSPHYPVYKHIKYRLLYMNMFPFSCSQAVLCSA